MNTMRVAIMQPYFIPYFAYYSLLATVDVYVVLDSVNFTQRRWINRNQVFGVNGEKNWLTLHLDAASQNRPIKDHYLLDDEAWKVSINGKMQVAIGEEPIARELIGLIRDLLSVAKVNLSEFNTRINKRICDFLGVETQFIGSDSLIGYQAGLTGQDRIIAICKKLGASAYVNPSGGREIYASDQFIKTGISLEFFDQDYTAIPEPLRAASSLQVLSRLPLPDLRKSLGRTIR